MKARNWSKAVETVLAAQMESKEPATAKPAFMLHDLAMEMDRLVEEMAEKAEYLAEKSTRFAASLRERGRGGSFENPTSYASTLFDLAKQDEALRVSENAFRSALFALYGQETAKAVYDAATKAVAS